MISRRRTAAVAITAAAAALAGCASNKARVAPAPELITLSDTPAEVANEFRLNTDLGRRMFLDDILRMWHADRPTRLAPVAIPY